MSSLKPFTKEDVAKHVTDTDCFVIISHKVYDITPFLYDHPGGVAILMDCAGKDATSDFDSIGHSDSARDMMKEYLVGSVQTANSNTVVEESKVHSHRHFKVDKITKINSDSYQYLLVPIDLKELPPLTLAPGQHVRIRVELDDGKHLERPYTPVANSNGTLTLLFKVYPKGVATQWLHGLKLGAELHVSTPTDRLHWDIVKDTYTHVALVAGGTGITPMYQVLNAYAHDKTVSRKPLTINLLYSSRSADEILLLAELKSLASANKNMHFTFTATDATHKPKDKEVVSGRIDAKLIKAKLDAAFFDGKKKDVKALVLVCGPPSFETAMVSHFKTLGYTEKADADHRVAIFEP